MAFIAIYDADALYPNTQRDLLIRIAQLPHLVQARWTEQILDEMLRALQKEPTGHLGREGEPPAGADERRCPGLHGNRL